MGVPSSRYDPVSEEELAASGLDYAAFGHVHAFSGLRRAGDCFYAWPGCPEGRGFDETGEKGVIIADVERGGVKLRFAPVCTRRYERLEVDASELESFRLPEEKAALRRNEQRQLLRALAQLRAESGAQLVLLAGDLFDSAASWAGTEDTLRLALAEMEVPVFISPGNHDFYSRSGRWQRLALDRKSVV